MTKQITAMLLFGGESSEHSVSILSARNVFTALGATNFKVILVYIDRNGEWWLLQSIDQVDNIKDALLVVPVLGTKSFMVLPNGNKLEPDVILPILHGENGEDGSIQGLAQLLHVPIVGCKISSSAICIDKVFTKQLLEYNNIKTVPYEVNMSYDPIPDYPDLANRLGEVLFVKPAGCGSSVGINKVSDSESLKKAIIEARKYDNKVLIEKAIIARELEVAMLGSGNNARASGVGEIVPDGDFYDFESKYSSSSQSKVLIPADIPEELSDRIKQIALKAYRVLGCEGLSRVDFFLADDGNVYLNEVNTLPGFTNISMYPKLWCEDGMAYVEIIEKLIEHAIDNTN
jgi:D-alanine-D-alanine ligase